MTPSPVYVVSGGMGASGEQVVRTALAQFTGADVPVRVVPRVQGEADLAAVIAEAASNGGIIVHTLVDVVLREWMADLARAHNVPAIDLIGPLLMLLSRRLAQKPLGQPGLYRQLHEDHFRQLEAIEFTMAHDDGCRPQELGLAQIVLVGVSRAGKTPLSIYLSTRGWKVANVPLIRGVDPPEELFQIDPRGVVGLAIDPAQLIIYRRRRQQSLGVPGPSSYTDPRAVEDEIDYARAIFRRGGFAVVDITDRPIEENADEVIAKIARR